MVFNVADWQHDEVETAEGMESLGTEFENRTYVVRAELNQRQTGALKGTFGVWTKVRDYLARGDEALTPPTEQTAFAAFVYEELSLARYRVQFSGRVERNAYAVQGRDAVDVGDESSLEPPTVRDRNFTGASASVGVQGDLGSRTSFVANLTRFYRAPALEELYTFGPHVGNLILEVGNPDLERESTLGLDLSLRHQSTRVRGNFNVYLYDIDDFIFAAVTDEVVDGLRVAPYLQGDSRFLGFEAEGSVRAGDTTWVNLGIGYVNAQLTTTDEALPRIPPLRGQLSVDLTYRGLTISPE